MKECIAIGDSKKFCNWKEHGSGIAFPAMVLVLSLLLLLFPRRSADIAQIVGCSLDSPHRERASHPLVDDRSRVHSYLYPSIDNPFGIGGRTRDVLDVWGRVGWVSLFGSA